MKVSMFFWANNAVSSGNWLILFEVLTLNVYYVTCVFPLSSFDINLSLSSVVDFSNSGA